MSYTAEVVEQDEELYPGPSLLRSRLTGGLSMLNAMCEFVDNSFGPSAGNTKYIEICILDDGIIFADKGAGIEKLDLMIKWGASDSVKSNIDIGQFGIGSKFGGLAIGTKSTFQTVVDGMYYSTSVDWIKCMEVDKWPAPVDKYKKGSRIVPRGLKFIQGGGTIITVQNKNTATKRPQIHTLLKGLGAKFENGFLDGYDIGLCKASTPAAWKSGKLKPFPIPGLTDAEVDAMKNGSGAVSVSKFYDQYLDTNIDKKGTEKIMIDGVECSLQIGVVKDGDKSLGGLMVAYGSRTVETLDCVIDENGTEVQLPGKVRAFLTLKSGGKMWLNDTKTQVIEPYREQIQKDIYISAMDLINELSADDEEQELLQMNTQLNAMLDPTFGSRKVSKSAKLKVVQEKTEAEIAETEIIAPEKGQGDGTGAGNGGGGRKGATEKKQAVQGSQYGYVGGKFNFAMTKVKEGPKGEAIHAKLYHEGTHIECAVFFNVDITLPAALMTKKGALYNKGLRAGQMAACMSALAEYVVEHPQEAEYFLDPETLWCFEDEPNPLEKLKILKDEFAGMAKGI